MTTPIYVPSLRRADVTNGTARFLLESGIEPWWFVVERPDVKAYANRYGRDRLLVLPDEYKERYDPCDEHGRNLPLGSGPSRNFAWDHAQEREAPWHWVLDDNIYQFVDFSTGNLTLLYKRWELRPWWEELERYLMQWRNLGMGGPMDYAVVMATFRQVPRAIINSRAYSFNLIRTSLPLRWRGRYNEDTILSIDILRAGWNTLQTLQWAMKKSGTQTVKGGNTDTVYRRKTTGPKSRILVRLFPKYATATHKWGRIHHYINYRKHWGKRPMVLDPDFTYEGR